MAAAAAIGVINLTQCFRVQCMFPAPRPFRPIRRLCFTFDTDFKTEELNAI